jgi:hypothetical protein
MRRVLEELPADRYPSLTCHVDELTAGDTRERFLFAVDTFVDGLLR